MFCEECGKQIENDSQFCEFCGTRQGAIKSISSSAINTYVKIKTPGIGKWLSQKNLFGVAAILIAISLFYYFLIRPIQEKRAYEDCFAALNETNQLFVGIQTSEKNFRIDTCVKSRNADEIRSNFEIEKATRQAEQTAKDNEVKRKEEQERAFKTAKTIPSYDWYSIKIQNIDFFYNGRVTGSIKNDQSYDIENLVIHLDLFTDKTVKNKVGETDCLLRNFIVYANSTKKFDVYCNIDDKQYWINYKLISGEKVL